MIRDVAWIADTLAHDAYLHAIYQNGPTDACECERCGVEMTWPEKRTALVRGWRNRLLCRTCYSMLRGYAGGWDADNIARRKAEGCCVTCGRPNDRLGQRVACTACGTRAIATKRRSRERARAALVDQVPV